MLEIERKFLVKNKAFKREAHEYKRITQGYLNRDTARTVRVRIYGDTGFLTIKGASDAGGTTRFEWEKKIDLKDAEALLPLCESGAIDKTRHLVKCGAHIFEIDEFHGDNQGLIVAEIELKHANEEFFRPNWLGEEVTGDPRFYNSQLSNTPYTRWTKPI